ncbi:MAG: hypothetical protein LPK92_11615, partial [Actinomycetes bacterium]|nr:hypothetical protein [Actinomycetes bacterium]
MAGFWILPAGADHLCPTGIPVHFVPDPAMEWEVEGKITAFDVAARTISVNGMTFTVPGGPGTLVITTGDEDAPPNKTFGEIFAPTDPRAFRSMLGA